MLQIYPLDKKRAKFSLFSFHFKKWHTLLFLPLWTSFKPIKDLKKKKTQAKQTLSSDWRSNIYNNQRRVSVLFLIFQTDTTNTELKSLWLHCTQSWIGLHWRQYIVSSRCNRKQSYKALKNTCPYPTSWSYPPHLDGCPVPAWVGWG